MVMASVDLKTDIYQRVKFLAEKRKRTSHWILREAIINYLEQEEFIEQIKNEAIEAWKHYQDTSLHVTGEEVLNWIASWGKENELEAPRCHV